MITSESQVSVEFALVVPYLDLEWGFVSVACSYYGVIMAYASIQQVQTLTLSIQSCSLYVALRSCLTEAFL